MAKNVVFQETFSPENGGGPYVLSAEEKEDGKLRVAITWTKSANEPPESYSGVAKLSLSVELDADSRGRFERAVAG